MSPRDENGHKPMAMCQCGAPLIHTFEWNYYEFYCQVCERRYEWLGPHAATWTQVLQDRHDELHAEYLIGRAEREKLAACEVGGSE